MLRLDRARLDLADLKRPQDSRQILKEAFRKYPCLDCGICCREGPNHTTMVTLDDPNIGLLHEEAMRRFPQRVRHAPFQGFRIMGEECCAFQDEDNRCSIYELRPIVCTLYPFMLQGLRTTTDKGEVLTIPFLVLTSFCPPLKGALEAGVTYVEADDFMPRKGKKKIIPGIPLLHSSYLQAMGLAKRDISIGERNFLVVDDRVVFPLF